MVKMSQTPEVVKARAVADAAQDLDAVVTHTTVAIAGRQESTIEVHAAATAAAQLVFRLGHMLMTFRSAEVVHEVITGFATVRSALGGVDGHSPVQQQPGARFASSAISIVWCAPPRYVAVPGNRYDPVQRRTIYWVDLHMGPVTWRIADREGYESLLEELRNVHRTAVAVFTDGGKYRKDPTKVLDIFDEV